MVVREGWLVLKYDKCVNAETSTHTSLRTLLEELFRHLWPVELPPPSACLPLLRIVHDVAAFEVQERHLCVMVIYDDV